jgi:hypothetical protein
LELPRVNLRSVDVRLSIAAPDGGQRQDVGYRSRFAFK